MSDLPKETLYEGVKILVENAEEKSHLHLNQHKLFTLFSLAFQYMLYLSTKKAGAYIIRLEDSSLADKLGRKAKDSSTRRFLNSLALPRKFKYGKSVFYMDFFHVGSWSMTNEIPKDKIQGAIIVRSANAKPMEEVIEDEDPMIALPPNYFLTSLMEFSPKTITIDYNGTYEELTTVNFPFIPKEKERVLQGITIASDINLDGLDD